MAVGGTSPTPRVESSELPISILEIEGEACWVLGVKDSLGEPLLTVRSQYVGRRTPRETWILNQLSICTLELQGVACWTSRIK